MIIVWLVLMLGLFVLWATGEARSTVLFGLVLLVVLSSLVIRWAMRSRRAAQARGPTGTVPGPSPPRARGSHMDEERRVRAWLAEIDAGDAIPRFRDVSVLLRVAKRYRHGRHISEAAELCERWLAVAEGNGDRLEQSEVRKVLDLLVSCYRASDRTADARALVERWLTNIERTSAAPKALTSLVEQIVTLGRHTLDPATTQTLLLRCLTLAERTPDETAPAVATALRGLARARAARANSSHRGRSRSLVGAGMIVWGVLMLGLVSLLWMTGETRGAVAVGLGLLFVVLSALVIPWVMRPRRTAPPPLRRHQRQPAIRDNPPGGKRMRLPLRRAADEFFSGRRYEIVAFAYGETPVYYQEFLPEVVQEITWWILVSRGESFSLFRGDDDIGCGCCGGNDPFSHEFPMRKDGSQMPIPAQRALKFVTRHEFEPFARVPIATMRASCDARTVIELLPSDLYVVDAKRAAAEITTAVKLDMDWPLVAEDVLEVADDELRSRATEAFGRQYGGRAPDLLRLSAAARRRERGGWSTLASMFRTWLS